MGRTDQAQRLIAATPAVLYRAVVEAEALERWLPPDGMTGRIERFDPRPGGGFRMELTYLDPADSPGKTSASREVTEVERGTEVSVRAENAPPGVSASDHEAGIASSLANLAAYV
jgi:uncharacterized protein YndB with AHSA1/START domain